MRVSFVGYSFRPGKLTFKLQMPSSPKCVLRLTAAKAATVPPVT